MACCLLMPEEDGRFTSRYGSYGMAAPGLGNPAALAKVPTDADLRRKPVFVAESIAAAKFVSPCL
eukprot:scaffold191322_cov39-Tisochrysis_lutea.AAC.4